MNLQPQTYTRRLFKALMETTEISTGFRELVETSARNEKGVQWLLWKMTDFKITDDLLFSCARTAKSALVTLTTCCIVAVMIGIVCYFSYEVAGELWGWLNIALPLIGGVSIIVGLRSYYYTIYFHDRVDAFFAVFGNHRINSDTWGNPKKVIQGELVSAIRANLGDSTLFCQDTSDLVASAFWIGYRPSLHMIYMDVMITIRDANEADAKPPGTP